MGCNSRCSARINKIFERYILAYSTLWKCRKTKNRKFEIIKWEPPLKSSSGYYYVLVTDVSLDEEDTQFLSFLRFSCILRFLRYCCEIERLSCSCMILKLALKKFIISLKGIVNWIKKFKSSPSNLIQGIAS